YPRAVAPDGKPLGVDDWVVVPTLVKRGAAIGANATIVCGVTIGEDAMVAAGSIVTRDVPPGSLVLGSPAHVVGQRPWNSVPARDAKRSALAPHKGEGITVKRRDGRPMRSGQPAISAVPGGVPVGEAPMPVSRIRA